MQARQERSIEERIADLPPPSLWRNRDFLLLWTGQIVSSVGTQVSQLALPLLVLAVTGSPAQAGVLTAVRSVPYVLFLLPAGALLDRWNRKRVMILCDTGRVIALGSVPVGLAVGRLTLLQLAVVALVEGTLFTFFNVAEASSLPNVVRKEQLTHAVGLSWTTDSVAALIGPAVSGALYGISRSLPFLADAISYAGSVVSLRFIRSEFQQERVRGQVDLLGEIREGLGWLWRRPVLRFLAILVGGLNLFSFGYPLIVIVRAQELHASPLLIGLLFATGGIGALAGSLAAAPLQKWLGFGRLMLWSTWIWVITWLPFAFAPTLPTFAVANILGWLIVPVFMVTQYSYRLSTIPDELQGRANSVFKLVAFGVQPFSLAMTGALLQLFGPISTIFIIVVPQTVLAVTATLYRPLRRA